MNLKVEVAIGATGAIVEIPIEEKEEVTEEKEEVTEAKEEAIEVKEAHIVEAVTMVMDTEKMFIITRTSNSTNLIKAMRVNQSNLPRMKSLISIQNVPNSRTC